MNTKPHFTLKGTQIVPQDLVTETSAENGVPAHLRKRSTGASMGNIDASDLKPPRLKILAGQSPEIMDGVPGAQVGHFWVTVLQQSLGQVVLGTPILLRKSYQVWAPKIAGSDQKGPLATSSDGIKWDTPDQVFDVKFPQAQGGKTYKWRIGKLVSDYGATKFGSQQTDDPKSKPIATLTYDVLWLIDMPDGGKQLCVFTNARTGIKPTQTFVSTTQAKGVDHFFQKYRIVAQRKTGPTGDPYFTYQYEFVDYLPDAECDFTQALYSQYSKSGFVSDMETEAASIDNEKPKPRSSGRKRRMTRRSRSDA